MGEIQRLLHDPAFFRLGLTLVHFLWQGLALAAVAWFLRAVLRGARPAVRYPVLLGIFALMAAAPLLTFTRWTQAPPGPDDEGGSAPAACDGRPRAAGISPPGRRSARERRPFPR